MRTVYAIGMAAFLAASPAMAQVVISTDNDSRHDRRAQQDRSDARQDQAQAQRDAAMGNYRGAAKEQREAIHEDRSADRQEHKADRDDRGVTVQLGR